jgi:outer membrane protein TolC
VDKGKLLVLLRPLRFSTLLFLLLPTLAWPQEELTLDQATSLALQKNRRVKISQLEVVKSMNAVEVARTNRLPQFKFTMMEGQLFTKLDFLFPAGSFGVFPGIGPFPPGPANVIEGRKPFTFVWAQANQPLSQLFRIRLGIDAEKLGVQIAKEKLSLEEQTVVNDVKKTYYNLLQTQSGLRATDETLKLFQELNRVVSNALAEQVALKSDVLDTETGLATVESQALQLRNGAATLKEKMNSLLGRDLKMEFTVSAAAETKPWELDLASTRAKALEQRPELREARLKIQQAEIDRRAKRAEYIPDVSLSFNYLSPFNVEILPKNIGAVGLVVNWDVFDWGKKKHELSSKIAVVEQAKTAVDEATAQIELEVGLDFRKLEEARLQLRVTNLGLQADQEKVRVALNKYEQNSVLLKDVLQLKATLAEKTFKYQEAVMTFWRARADLEKAIGER